MTGLVDSHCHLDDAAFDADRDDVLARARAAGVAAIVVPAVRPATWERTAAACRARGLHLALGVHPQAVPTLSPEEERRMAGLAAALGAARAIAVGECGLDGPTADQPDQQRVFRLHIAVARELRLPLLVHVFRAHDAALALLRAEPPGDAGGVLHSYSGGADLVAAYADLGFAFAFAGAITYAGARRPALAARAVPAPLLLAETDAPDQTPAPHRGGRNEPGYLPLVVAAIARARGLSDDEAAALTSANARRALRLPEAP